MEKQFKILYPKDYPDIEKRGKIYTPLKGRMIVMDQGGMFFEYYEDKYESFINKLEDILPNFDVTWQ